MSGTKCKFMVAPTPAELVIITEQVRIHEEIKLLEVINAKNIATVREMYEKQIADIVRKEAGLSSLRYFREVPDYGHYGTNRWHQSLAHEQEVAQRYEIILKELPGVLAQQLASVHATLLPLILKRDASIKAENEESRDRTRESIKEATKLLVKKRTTKRKLA